MTLSSHHGLVRWLLGGLFLGGIIHVIAVFGVPMVTESTPWNGIAGLGAQGRFHLVQRDDTPVGALDPAMIHAACAFDLAGTSSELNLDIQAGLWTVSVFDSFGRSVFALAGREPRLGLSLVTANAAEEEAGDEEETAEEETEERGERDFAARVPDDRGFIILRIFSPHANERRKITEDLAGIRCA